MINTGGTDGERPAYHAQDLPRKKNDNAVRRCRWRREIEKEFGPLIRLSKYLILVEDNTFG